MRKNGHQETPEELQRRLESYDTLREQAEAVLAAPALYGAIVTDRTNENSIEAETESGVTIGRFGGWLTVIWSNPDELHEGAWEYGVTREATFLNNAQPEFSMTFDLDGGPYRKTPPLHEHADFAALLVRQIVARD